MAPVILSSASSRGRASTQSHAPLVPVIPELQRRASFPPPTRPRLWNNLAPPSPAMAGPWTSPPGHPWSRPDPASHTMSDLSRASPRPYLL